MIGKNSPALYLLPFILDFMMGGISIAVPLLAIMLNASPLTLGILGFSPGVAYISLCLVFGKLSEVWHRKNLLSLGLFLYTLSSLILCFSSRIYQLYLSMLLIGIGAAMFWPTLEAWIAEREEKKPLARKMGIFNTSWSLGQALGPLAGGMLFAISLRLPFYLVFLVGLFSFFILLKGIPGDDLSKRSRSIDNSSPSSSINSSYSFYVNISRIANFTLWFSLGVIRYIFPKLGTNLGISSSFLGLLMFALFSSQTLIFYGLGIFRNWQYTIYPLIFFQVLALSGLAIIFFSSSFVLFLLAFLLIGAGIGMTHSSSLFHSVNTVLQKGPRAAVHEIFLAAGGLSGPLIGGIIAQRFSLRTPYLVAFLIIGGGIVVEILIKIRASSCKN